MEKRYKDVGGLENPFTFRTICLAIIVGTVFFTTVSGCCGSKEKSKSNDKAPTCIDATGKEIFKGNYVRSTYNNNKYIVYDTHWDGDIRIYLENSGRKTWESGKSFVVTTAPFPPTIEEQAGREYQSLNVASTCNCTCCKE